MTLKEFFDTNPKAALAFSGGTDSVFLLHEAVKYGADVKAYYVKSAFQPQFELDDALKAAEEFGAKMEVLEVDVLKNDEVTRNPADRCYHCKKVVFGTIAKAAAGDGYRILLDGTNASDDDSDRPGSRVLRELSVLSPLRLCGLTKDRIRELSREEGIFTWNKPAYACLATRIPTGTVITQDLLKNTELAENYLFSEGFTDFRVRYLNGAAKIQVTKDQLMTLIERREKIVKELGQWYMDVYLDLKTRDGD